RGDGADEVLPRRGGRDVPAAGLRASRGRVVVHRPGPRAGPAAPDALPLGAARLGERPAAADAGGTGPLGPVGRRGGSRPPAPPADVPARLARTPSGGRPDPAQAAAGVMIKAVTMEAVWMVHLDLPAQAVRRRDRPL